MGKITSRKRKSPSSSYKKSNSTPKKTTLASSPKNQSVLSQLSTLRELLHGSSYEEIDLSNCLRQCRYNVQLAAEQLITGQYVSNGSKDDDNAVSTSSSSSGSSKCSKVSGASSQSGSDQSQSAKKSALITEESSSSSSSMSMVEGTKPSLHASGTIKVKSSPETKRKETDISPHTSKSSCISRTYGSKSAKILSKSNGNKATQVKQHRNSNGLLLCQRWIVGFSTCRRGSIKYHESVVLSTSTAPPSSSRKGANIVRFRGDNVEGTLDTNLGSMLAPLMRTTHENQNQQKGDRNDKSSRSISEKPLIKVVARGLMEDPLLNIGMEVPLELMVYILRPIEFFALFQDMYSTQTDLFFKGSKAGVSRVSSSLSTAAFELLQWAQYGNAPTFECSDEKSTSLSESSDSDTDSTSSFKNESKTDGNEEDDQNQDDNLVNGSDLEANAPSWVGDVYAQSGGDLKMNVLDTIPVESDPPSMNKKGVILKVYQRQALYWMVEREARENGKNSKNFRDQLELLSELAADNRSSQTQESQEFDSSNPDCANGIQCSVGPVLVDESVAANSSTLDGTKDPVIHPLWQRRFLWDKDRDTHGGAVFSFYVNELLQIASMKAPNPPKECCGGILADAMGLGKTVMLIALMSRDCEMKRTDDLLVEDTSQSSHSKATIGCKTICLDSDDDVLAEKKLESKMSHHQVSGSALHTTLVVAPLSLLAQWEEEITTKSSLSCLSYYGDQAHKPSKSQVAGVDVLITTYGTLHSEYSHKSKKGSLLFSIQFHRVILDEAHAIKNPKTGASKACCAVKADKRWCVTGTPISNSLQDVYGLLKFLKHEPWCESSFWKRAIKSVKPSDGDDDDGGESLSISLGRVRRVLEPMLLRRTKDTLSADGEPILKLPPIDSQVIPVILTEDERLFYDALLTKSQDVFDGFVKAGTASKSWFAIFSLLQRLRQACDHLSLTVKSRLDGDLRNRSIQQEGEGYSENARECSIDEDLSTNDKVRYSNLHDIHFAITSSTHICNCSLFPKFITDLLKSHQSEGGNEYSQKVVDTLTQCIEEDGCLEDECAICLEVPKKDDLAVTPCHHIFCRSCLLDNLASGQSGSGQCPICSEQISKDNLICSQIGETKRNSSKRDKGPDLNNTSDFKGILNLAIQGNCSSKMLSVFHEMDKVWSEDPESKILIFSQYLGMLDLIQFHLEKRRIGNFRLDGSMSHSIRRKTLDSFNSYKVNSTIGSAENAHGIRRGCVLLASMKACGVGMNLTVASSVFIIDPWWSFALEKQCINRIHRIGQTADVVRLRKFVVSDSVEEKIVKMQESKLGMASEVLSDKPSGIDGSSNPSLDDLKAIFGR